MNPPPSSQEPSVRDAAVALNEYFIANDMMDRDNPLRCALGKALATSQPVRDLKQSPRPASQCWLCHGAGEMRIEPEADLHPCPECKQPTMKRMDWHYIDHKARTIYDALYTKEATAFDALTPYQKDFWRAVARAVTRVEETSSSGQRPDCMDAMREAVVCLREEQVAPRPAQATEAEAINRDLFEACRATRNLLRPCLEEPHRTVFWKCVDAMNQAMQLAAAPPSSESAPSHKGEAK